MATRSRRRRRVAAASAASRRKGKRAGTGRPTAVLLFVGAAPRLRSTLPPALHRVGGRTVLEAALEALRDVAPALTIAPIPPAGRTALEGVLADRPVRSVAAEPPLGDADAVAAALGAIPDDGGDVLVLSADMPLLLPGTVAALLERRRSEGLDLLFLSFRPPAPGDFSRVVRDRRGKVRRLAAPGGGGGREGFSEEVGAGLYCFRGEALRNAVARLPRDPATGERSLAGAVEILARRSGRVDALVAEDWREAWRIRTRRDLAAAEEIVHRRRVEQALDAGATILDPATTRLGPRVRLDADAVVHPFVSLEGDTTIGERAEILPFTRIVDSTLAPAAVVGPHCELDGARIGSRSRVGPFARFRPGSVLEEDVRVGNFVETKNTTLHDGVKAQHLAYLGDADIGARSNIGAGVITCNYDGAKKHPTKIGEEVFVGSDAQLVAPVTIGRGAYVGAGATVTEDVPAGALALSRVAQTNVEGWVERRKAKQGHAEHGTPRKA